MNYFLGPDEIRNGKDLIILNLNHESKWNNNKMEFTFADIVQHTQMNF